MPDIPNDSLLTEKGNLDKENNRNPQSALRVLELPAHLREIPRCEGIPDLFITHCVTIGLTLLTSTLFAGLLCAPFLDGSHERGGIIGGVLWLLILACIAWMIVLSARGFRRRSVWFEVDGTGFRYGNGKSSDGATSGEQRIEWREIVANPSEKYDVRYNSSSKVAMTSANFEFWRRVKRNSSEKYTLPKNLMRYDANSDGIRCIRFKNRDALIVAILCGLAHQGLRFSPGTFVAAGIHPETWQKLRTPWRAACVFFSLVFLAGLWAFEVWGSESLPFPVAIFLVCWLLYCTEGKYLFSPDLKRYASGPIAFRIDSTERE